MDPLVQAQTNNEDLKRQLSIAKAQDNHHILKDRNEQLQAALDREAALKEQLHVEKGKLKVPANTLADNSACRTCTK